MMLRAIREGMSYGFLNAFINPELIQAIQNSKAAFAFSFAALIYLSCLHFIKPSIICFYMMALDGGYFKNESRNRPHILTVAIKNDPELEDKILSTHYNSEDLKDHLENRISRINPFNSILLPQHSEKSIIGCIGYIINRAILFTIATLSIIDLIQTFQGNTNILGFHTLPKFLTQSNEVLAFTTLLIIAASILLLANTIADMININKIYIKNDLKNPARHLDDYITFEIEKMIGLEMRYY